MSDPGDTRGREWKAQEPPADFADRVMAQVEEASALEARRAPRTTALSQASAPVRRARLVAGLGGALALAASVVLAVAWRGGRAPDHGDAIAADRTQMALGGRAVAVLERGARVSWSGDEVNQAAGDVFYRVEPGGAFRVHTPGGDVAVLGTCFRVKVEMEGANAPTAEDAVNGRDVKAGVIGATIGAVALVSVYEGKVAVSRASERVTLTAGETARADATGVHRGAGAGALAATSGAGGAPAEDVDPLVAANANLADSVREYKQRLEAIEAQKTTIAKQLGEAQEKLAIAQNDGQAPPVKNAYDLDQSDWKQLAKEGKVVARMPCGNPDSWNVSPKELDKLGLAPQDAQPIHDALQRSAARIWTMVRPLCIQALQGDAQTADKLGPGTCQSLVGDVSRDKEDTGEETRIVAEIRGGLRPMPSDPSVLGTYGKMLYALSGESKAIEHDISQSIGPDDAHRFTFGEEGNWCQSAWGAGPRPELPPK